MTSLTQTILLFAVLVLMIFYITITTSYNKGYTDCLKDNNLPPFKK